ncbi:MAG: two-component regulator propeller domain-containing protein [Candidatus Gracilibacteria bacterium]|nr:two-component regulator propeller domain-containing protein [Candidatus Gracilibacteria bacterium]
MKTKKGGQGFTLVELIVVITILAILGTIAFINLQGYSGSARDSKRESDISNILKKVSVEQIKGVTGGELIDNQASKSVVINNISTNAIQGIPKFSQLKEDGTSFKDPTTKSDYVLSYAKGGTSTGAYNFLQIATINEERNEAVVKGNYYMYNTSTDSPSIVKNVSNLFVVDGGSQLPYELVTSGNEVVTSNPFPSGWTNFTTIDGIGSNDTTGLWEDHNGNIWVGSRGGGVSKYDGTTWTNYLPADGLLSYDVFGLFEDTSGNMWFANWGGDGAQKFDGTTWTTYTPGNSGLPASWLSVIREDHLGNIWFGTDGGAAKFDGTSWTTYNIGNSGLPDNEVYGMLEDVDGNMWFATSGGGVAKFDVIGNSWTVYNVSNSGFTTNLMGAITEDNSGNIWAGAYNNGMYRYNKLSSDWTIFPKATLPSSAPVSWIIDDNGAYWGATHSGLLKSTGLDLTTGQLYSTGNSGIISNTIEMILKDKYGNIWSSTSSGISVFNPN